MIMSAINDSTNSPISTVMDVLAGVASVAGQNRAVAMTNPTSGPSSGRTYERFWRHVPTSATSEMTP